MIEIDDKPAVEASLTIVLRGDDVNEFKDLLERVERGWAPKPGHRDTALRIWKVIS